MGLNSLLEVKVIIWSRVAAVLFLCVLLTGSAWAQGPRSPPAPQELVVRLDFTAPSFTIENDSYHISIPQAPGCLILPGLPVLPKYVSTFTLPFGSRVIGVHIQTSHLQELVLCHPMTQTPKPILTEFPAKSQNDDTNGPLEYYPPQQVMYQTGGGLDGVGRHVTFFTLIVVPAQYQASTSTLRWACNWTISITYAAPAQYPFPLTSQTPLVIISPDKFIDALSPLVEHKIAMGLPTTVKSLTDIYRDYTGRDKAEEVKMFIKDAVDHWGTKYVLLVGGLSSVILGRPRDSASLGARDWLIPVRYSNLKDMSMPADPGFISDLYYADLYNGAGQFCSWDSNGDGIYGGWDKPTLGGLAPLMDGTDTLDFYPDVYVGRLPCRTVHECKTMVEKIIAYENVPSTADWMSKLLVVGGDPYWDAGTDIYEGEVIGNAVIADTPGLSSERLFASYENFNSSLTPVTKNILRELNAGVGLVLFDGHGGPTWWNTCWPGRCNATIPSGGIAVNDLVRLHNGGMTPVTVIGGCHCCLFNETVFSSSGDFRNLRSSWSYGRPVARCLGEALLEKRSGGSVAVIGSTGLGYEQSGENGDLDGDGVNLPDACEALGGYLELGFFQAYHNGTRPLGALWNAAISQYLDHYPGMYDRDDAKTVEQWVLLGDPSLHVGGYS